jgi:pyridoxal phosphate enzyme (YggS family)
VRSKLEENWTGIRRRIRECAQAAGRPAEAVTLVAVTKGVDAELALELHALGQHELGENRIDELERKLARAEAAGLRPRWHFLGHVQRNKARRVVRAADVIQSVDSEELLVALARHALEEGRRPELYFEVKLAPDPAKTGFERGALRPAIERAAALGAFELAGLMTIAPLVPPEHAGEAARRAFAELASIARSIEAEPSLARHFRGARVRTSMGMSADFELAIAAGSDLVRIGSALFAGLAPAPGGGGVR